MVPLRNQMILSWLSLWSYCLDLIFLLYNYIDSLSFSFKYFELLYVFELSDPLRYLELMLSYLFLYTGEAC